MTLYITCFISTNVLDMTLAPDIRATTHIENIIYNCIALLAYCADFEKINLAYFTLEFGMKLLFHLCQKKTSNLLYRAWLQVGTGESQCFSFRNLKNVTSNQDETDIMMKPNIFNFIYILDRIHFPYRYEHYFYLKLTISSIILKILNSIGFLHQFFSMFSLRLTTSQIFTVFFSI